MVRENKQTTMTAQPAVESPATPRSTEASQLAFCHDLGPFAMLNSPPLHSSELTFDVSHSSTFSGANRRLSRLRETGTIQIGDYLHYARVSYPDISATGSTSEDSPVIMLYPGLTEMTDIGPARNLHNLVAILCPSATVVSIATDGISHHGPKITRKQALETPFTLMGEHRQKITRHFAGQDSPVTALGLSMGALVVLETELANMRAAPSQRYNLAKIELLSPGAVACNIPAAEMFRDEQYSTTAERIAKFQQFLKHAAFDAVREAVRAPHRAPEMLLANIAITREFASSPERAAALYGNVVQCLRGIEWTSLQAVTAEHPNAIHVTTGANDPLAELRQYDALGVPYTAIPGAGHLFSANAHSLDNRFREVAGASFASLFTAV